MTSDTKKYATAQAVVGVPKEPVRNPPGQKVIFGLGIGKVAVPVGKFRFQEELQLL
jgi:hypothetical protein